MVHENLDQMRLELFAKQIHDKVSLLKAEQTSVKRFELFDLKNEFELKDAISLYRRMFPENNDFDYNYFANRGAAYGCYVVEVKTRDCITHSSSNMDPTDDMQMYKHNIIDPKLIPYAHFTREEAATTLDLIQGYIDQDGNDISGFKKGYFSDCGFPRGTLDPDKDFDEHDGVGQYFGILRKDDFYYVVGLTSENNETEPRLYPIRHDSVDGKLYGYCDPEVSICGWANKPKCLKYALKSNILGDYHFQHEHHLDEIRYLVKEFNFNAWLMEILCIEEIER